MSLPLYMDHHIPAAITQGLRRRGLDVLTCRDDETTNWEDNPLFERAAELDRILFTMDEDHLAIARRWQQTGREFAGLLFAHALGISIGKAIDDIELIATACDLSEMRNQVQYLPL